MSAWAGVSAAVLAGGMGTRLRPAVADRPKVLAPVGVRPFLSHLLHQLAHVGLRDVVLLTGHGAEQVRSALGDHYAGVRLIHSREPSPLGTAGAVRWALPLLREETIFLCNGDSYCDINLGDFRDFHRSRGAKVSVVVVRVPDASRFGRVQSAPDGRILSFEEKRRSRAPGWISAGLYLIRRGLLEDLPPGRPTSLEHDLLPAWVRAGLAYGFAGGERFLDIGTPESYGKAETFFRGQVGGRRRAHAG